MARTGKGAFIILKPQLILIIALLFSAGCSTMPFKNTSYRVVKNLDPAVVREDFESLLPASFKTIDSIVFKYSGKSYSAIGYTDVDTSKNTFKAVCINQVGVKLLELSVTGDGIEYGHALQEFTEKGDIVQAMANDIRNIYFDRVPSSDAGAYKKKYKIIFKQPFSKGEMEYVFAGTDNLLVEKRYFENKVCVWRVLYYEYTEKDGKIYPKGIVFKHHLYGYSLIIKLKEICQ